MQSAADRLAKAWAHHVAADVRSAPSGLIRRSASIEEGPLLGRGIAASFVLALGLAPAAFAEERLMEVKVPTVSLYHQLYTTYDFVEANQFNGDGSVSTDVVVDDDEQAALRAQGVQFIRTLEDDATTAARNAEAEQALAEQRLSASLASNGAPSGAIKLRGKSIVPTLSVADPSSNATGRFVNGAFSLPQALQANAGGPFAAVGGSAAPTLLKSWTAPSSRTGTYGKTLTFTLSTTTP